MKCPLASHEGTDIGYRITSPLILKLGPTWRCCVVIFKSQPLYPQRKNFLCRLNKNFDKDKLV